MTIKINNLRKCILTNKILSKSDLIRLVVIDNKLVIDWKQNKKHRGYYIINNPAWIKENIPLNVFKRKVRFSNGEEIYNAIINL